MHGDQRRMYGDLSWMWPIISPPEHYVEEAQQFVDMVRKFSKIEPETLLDIGCGGGHVSHNLNEHFDVIGVDLSENMLALARKLNPDIEHHLGDMREIRLDRKFDVVIIADAICYMLTEDDLKAAFVTAYEHLKPGGVFCTYAEKTTESFQQNEVAYSIHKKDDIEITFIENNFDPDTTDSTYEYLAIFVIRSKGKLDVQTDKHISGLFSLDTWPRLLREVGFEVEQMTLYGDVEGEDFPFFVCVKPL